MLMKQALQLFFSFYLFLLSVSFQLWPPMEDLINIALSFDVIFDKRSMNGRYLGIRESIFQLVLTCTYIRLLKK